MVCSPKPSTASTIWLWKDSRRISPSVTTGSPARSWSEIAQSTARSSARLNSAAEIPPSAKRRLASSSSGGRNRLPTTSARAVITASLPETLVVLRRNDGQHRAIMSHESIFVEEEDVGGRYGNVPGADLAPLEPDLPPVIGLVDEVAKRLVVLAGDDDRIVTILFPDLLDRLVEVHLRLSLALQPPHRVYRAPWLVSALEPASPPPNTWIPTSGRLRPPIARACASHPTW